MLTLLRRFFWLGLLGGAGYAGWTLWRRQTAPTPAAAPEWPPLAPLVDRPEVAADATVAAPADAPEHRAWVEPVDGACPDGYPIKANDNSGIYHVPGGRFYARTVPERCYADTEAAEADGYRAAKA
jgi:hypothetical protein